MYILTFTRAVPFGLVVWSTGLALNPLIEGLQGVSKSNKAVFTDPSLHVLDDQGQPMKDVWAIGDCAMVKDVAPLPATAQGSYSPSLAVIIS